MDIEKLKELLNKEYTDLTPDDKVEIKEFYQFIYSTVGCSSCKNQIVKYFNKLKENGIYELEKINTSVIESKFQLRTNISGVSFNGKVLSNNSDDSIAIEFLKLNPKRISLFEKYPSNWQEMITQNETANE